MVGLDPDGKVAWLSEAVGTVLRQPYGLIAGIGDDDCAVIDLAGQPILVVTSDYVNANPIILSLGIGSYFDVGRYLINSNLADLCGSGAEPVAILTSIMWDRSRTEAEFEQLMQGAKSAAISAGVAIVGGDTKLSSRAAYCGVGIGTAKTQSCLFLKDRARPGNSVWVSGNVGSCGAAVYGWEKLSSANEWIEWAHEAIRNPTLPLDLARKASALEMEASGTDLSDGLGADLAGLCDASKVGVEIRADAIPVDRHLDLLSAELSVPPYAFAFTVGGDLQFLLCASEQYSLALESLGMVKIGTVHQDPAYRKLIDMHGALIDLPSAGHRDARAMTFRDEVGYLLRSQGFGVGEI
jgi:thiamine-monophosphate kinase